MKNFIVFDGTGKIIKTGYCSNRIFNLQGKEPGESIMAGKADDIIHEIIGNEVIEKVNRQER